MNINKALKEKNRLVNKINNQFKNLKDYNSIRIENVRPYNPYDCLQDIIKKIDNLIELKTLINKANVNVYDKILRLGELKSLVNHLKSLNCNSGIITQGFSEQKSEYIAAISVTDRDNLILKYETEIEKIQDDLDYYNQVTEI